jgi:hypothetical protein
MAENILFKITMLTDRSDGTASESHLDVGGQFASYWDDSAGAIIVRDISDASLLASTDFGSGGLFVLGPDQYTCEPALILVDYSYYVKASYSFCSGFDLKEFELNGYTGYPFATQITTTNSYQCTSATCNLLVNSIDVVNSSTLTANDGQITVNSTTDNTTIQYSLSPFSYGAGQTSNVFTGLAVGTYTIYVVDDQGCQNVGAATVGVIPSAGYQVKYRIGYQDINGNDGRFDIFELDYAGSIVEVTSGGSPIVYTNNEKDQFDIFKGQLKSSYVTITLPEDTKFKYRELFTQDARQYKGIWYKDTGAGYSELWRGYLVPEVFQAPYTFLPYVEITFSDQLNSIELFEFGSENNTTFLPQKFRYYNDFQLLDIFVRALKSTDLELPIRSAINMYELNHTTLATSDPLAQTYIDAETFYKDDEPKSYKEVLEIILATFGAKIVQWGGYWWIIRTEENRAAFDYREYDKDGVYVTNSSYNPIKYIYRACITDARFVWLNQDASYEILPAGKTISVINNLDRRESILENYNFSRINGYGVFGNVPDLWTLNKDDTNVSILAENVNGQGVYSLTPENALAFNVSTWGNNVDNCYVQLPTQSIQYESGDKFKFSFDVAVDRIDQVFPYMIIKARVKIGSNYLIENGEWQTTVTDLRFYPSIKNGFQTVEIEADFPSASTRVTENIDIRIYAYQAACPDFGEYTGSPKTLQSGDTNFRDSDTLFIPVGTKKSVSDGSFVVYHYTLTEGTDATSAPDIIRPTDYANTTNEKVWVLDKSVRVSSFPIAYLGLLQTNTNTKYYVDNVIATVLPNGQEIVDTETIKIDVNAKYLNDYEYEIQASDLLPIHISSSKYLYKSLFKLASGANTQYWARSSTSEALTIQQILAKVLTRQYSTASNKLSGTLTSNNQGGTHIDLTPLDCLVETMDGGIVYLINGLTIEDKSLSYNVQLVDSKATSTWPAAAGTCDVAEGGGGTVDTGGTGSTFTGDFNADYGTQFDTILN